MIKVLQGRTYDMLAKDKRVQWIELVVSETNPDEHLVYIILAPPWFIDLGHSRVKQLAGYFTNWNAARNWVRKAKMKQELPL